MTLDVMHSTEANAFMERVGGEEGASTVLLLRHDADATAV